MLKYEADLDLDRITDEADPRDVCEGMAVRDFKAACSDLLLNGWTEADLVNLIEQSLPIAEEIVEFELTIPADPFA